MKTKQSDVHRNAHRKLGVAILGTGRIGTDLLIKTMRSDLLECRLVAGRNANSGGLKHAQKLGVPTSPASVRAIVDAAEEIDVVFDATSASDHRKHAPLLEGLGMLAIDLTPAKVGPWCVPSINLEAMRYAKNINLITCGGQASVPIVEVITRELPTVEHVHVHSLVSFDSIGPATLANIDDYYASTALALKHLGNARQASVELEVAPESERPFMVTTIRARAGEVDLEALCARLDARVHSVQRYVPGYSLAEAPRYKDGELVVTVRVKGRGDFLPEHAGNLDIINCAALAVAEDYAFRDLYLPKPSAPVRAGLEPVPWLRHVQGAWSDALSFWTRQRTRLRIV